MDQNENAASRVSVDAVVIRRRTDQARIWCEQQIRPFVDLILRVRLRERPKYIFADGTLTKIDDGLSEPDRAIVASCEEQIEYIWNRAEKWISCG